MAQATGQHLRKRIKNRLLERLRASPLGTKLPPVRMLAREFGAAYLTVNGALKELEQEGYIRCVPRRGAFLASRERTVVRDVDTGTTRLRTVVVAYANCFSYSAWIRLHLAEERAVKQGLALLEFKMNPNASYEGLYDYVKSRSDVCGVIVIPVPGLIGRAEVARFDDLGMPVVLLEPSNFAASAKRVWSISSDWFRDGYLKARHLLSLKHHELAYVQHEPVAVERQTLLLRGMRQAIRDFGGKPQNLAVVTHETGPWEDGREEAYVLTRELLASTKVTGCMYESMRGIQGGLRAAHEAGLRIPQDIAFVTTGLGTHDEDYFESPIAVVESSPAEEMDQAFACILSPDAQPVKRLTVTPVLHASPGLAQTVRPSTAAVPRGASS